MSWFSLLYSTVPLLYYLFVKSGNDLADLHRKNCVRDVTSSQSWTKNAARKINSHNITGQTAVKHYMKL